MTGQSNANESCLMCGAGKYGTMLAQTNESEACRTCEKGYYCPGGSSHHPCPIGTYNNFTQQHNLSSCIQCDKGKYGKTQTNLKNQTLA